MMTKRRNIALYIVLGIVIILPYAGFWGLHQWYISKAEDIKNARFIIVDKSTMTLALFDYRGEEMMCFPMACGKVYGDKQKRGDMRTPEGIFHIESIEDASNWTHDFGGGKGEIDGAYGTLFIRLACPGHKGIGIHGTHLPESLGTRASEGCIRLDNNDIVQLARYVHTGMVVAIIPSADDAVYNQ
ncbi:MAG: L,D-transpeptidase [bacterium]